MQIKWSTVPHIGKQNIGVEIMKVCDVVLNSIWYDPRVRKQITEYIAHNVNIAAVGLKCSRYDDEKVRSIPCKTHIVHIDARYDGQQKGVWRKFNRERQRNRRIMEAIIAEKPDIIHANDLNALIPAYTAKRKLSCKLVFDAHEIYVENYTSEGYTPIKKLMFYIERFLVHRVDLMICVSHAAAEYYSRTYHIRKPLVITNCSLRKEIIESNEFVKHDGFEILNHGQFYPGRGYEIMVEACALLEKIPDVRLAIRGFGRLENHLREMVSRLANSNQFIFYSPVSIQELIPAAAQSHVGVAISIPVCLNFELSVSNKLFEYASAGLPVIMSDIPEHRYLNGIYNFGIILGENTPMAFADAVKRLYQDRTLYSTLSKNAKRMSMELNWENEFLNLIKEEKRMVENIV